jgi:hypothetical protein
MTEFLRLLLPALVGIVPIALMAIADARRLRKAGLLPRRR